MLSDQISILTPLLSCATEVNKQYQGKNIFRVYSVLGTTYEHRNICLPAKKKGIFKLDIETLSPLLQGISKEAGQGDGCKNNHSPEIRIPIYAIYTGARSKVTLWIRDRNPTWKTNLKTGLESGIYLGSLQN